jgi:transcriptional regulator with XRE-family HTH domain
MPDDTERQVLGQRIREARNYLEMSQEEVAAAIGVSRQAMVAIEAGTRGVGALELKRLAKILNRSVQYLSGEEEASPADEKVAMLARAAEGLTDSDLSELQRFAAYLKARSDG